MCTNKKYFQISEHKFKKAVVYSNGVHQSKIISHNRTQIEKKTVVVEGSDQKKCRISVKKVKMYSREEIIKSQDLFKISHLILEHAP